MKTGMANLSSSMGPRAMPPRKAGRFGRARIVGGSGEGEADGGRRLRQGPFDRFESAYDGGQAAIQVVGLGGNAQPLDQGLAAAPRAELQIGATGVERHHDAAVVIKWNRHVRGAGTRACRVETRLDTRSR